jgi:hypothetical protein
MQESCHRIRLRAGEGKKERGLRSEHNRQAERRRQEKAVAVNCGPRLDKPLRKNQKCWKIAMVTIGRPNT